MPKGSKKELLERQLRAAGEKKGLSGARLNAYIYGTLTKTIGPKKAKTASKTGKVKSTSKRKK